MTLQLRLFFSKAEIDLIELQDLLIEAVIHYDDDVLDLDNSIVAVDNEEHLYTAKDILTL